MDSPLKHSQYKNVGIAQCHFSEGNDIILVAPHLGSCVGVGIYAPSLKISGMVHCLLPLSKSDEGKAAENPYMYVDTGVTKLISIFLEKGATKKELQIYVAGGASINDVNGVFEIGKKNFTVLRKLLWKNSLLIKGEHVGGQTSRSIFLDAATGKAQVKVAGEIIEF